MSAILNSDTHLVRSAGVYNLRPARFYYMAAAIFVNCLYTIKITQYSRRLGVPVTVIVARPVREAAHNNGCGPVP